MVTHEEEIDNKKKYHYKQYEIKSHDSSGWKHIRPDPPIFIEVLDNNKIVIKVDGKPITEPPLISAIFEATEMKKDYYEKYVRKFLDVLAVVGTIGTLLAIPGVIVLAV